MKKKIATWHKNTTAKKQPKKQTKSVDSGHWIQSRARLMKILEASGIKQENCKAMLPHSIER